MKIQHDDPSVKYLKMFMTTSNLSTAGQKGLSERRIVEILKGEKPTETEMMWLERGFSESSLDILTGLVWHLQTKPSQLSGLFKLCNVTRTDWDYD